MSGTIEELHKLLDSPQDMQSVEAWLQNHKIEVYGAGSALADECLVVYRQSIESKQLDKALQAILIASRIHEKCGLLYNSIVDKLYFYNLLTVGTDSEQEYRSNSTACKNLVLMAEKIKAYDLAFGAAVIVAENIYFCCDTNVASQANEIFDSLLYAAHFANFCKHDIWLAKFISLLANSVKSYLDEYCRLNDLLKSFDQSEDSSPANEQVISSNTEHYLRQLCLVAETLFPNYFEFYNESLNTVLMNLILAKLSYQYGSPALGNTRLDQAIKQNISIDKFVEWLELAYTRYQWSKKTYAPSAEISELRLLLHNHIESFRSQYRSRTGRLWFAQMVGDIYLEFLDDELNDFNVNCESTFNFIEAIKSRLLTDDIHCEYHSFPSKMLTNEFENKEQEILSFALEDIENYEDVLLKKEMLLVSQQPVGELLDNLNTENKVTELEMYFHKYSSGFSESISPITLDKIKSILGTKEILIEYYIPYRRPNPGSKIWAIVITSDTEIIIPLLSLNDEEVFNSTGGISGISVDHRQPRQFGPLASLVSTLRLSIQNSGELHDKILRYLYQILIAPLQKYEVYINEFEDCIVIPHGVLCYVPFHALRDEEDKYLIEDLAVTIAPSAAVWYSLQKQNKPPVTSFLGFGNPTLKDECDLPHSDAELTNICSRLKNIECFPYKREKATFFRLKKHIKDKGIVHFATHGEFPEQNVMDFHNIRLTPTKSHDGMVHAKNIRKLDFTFSRLTVLSICNGGVYRIGPGNEPYGLIPALITAGSENVIAPLWPIDDNFTKIFMSDYYKHLLKYGPAEALRQTCIEFINNKYDKPDIKSWASFALVGSGLPKHISSKKDSVNSKEDLFKTIEDAFGKSIVIWGNADQYRNEVFQKMSDYLESLSNSIVVKLDYSLRPDYEIGALIPFVRTILETVPGALKDSTEYLVLESEPLNLRKSEILDMVKQLLWEWSALEDTEEVFKDIYILIKNPEVLVNSKIFKEYPNINPFKDLLYTITKIKSPEIPFVNIVLFGDKKVFINMLSNKTQTNKDTHIDSLHLDKYFYSSYCISKNEIKSQNI